MTILISMTSVLIFIYYFWVFSLLSLILYHIYKKLWRVCDFILLAIIVQSLSCVWLFATPWTSACRGSLSFTISQSYSNSCPLGWWRYVPISSSVLFSFCFQSFPASGSFLISQPFTSGGQSIGASLLFIWTLHSVGYIFPFFPCFLLIFFPQLFVKSPETTTLPSCSSFSLGWFSSLPFVQCYEPLFIVIQALYLLDIIPWIYSSLPLYNHMGFDLGHNWMALVVFPSFFSLSLNFAMRSSWSKP